MKTDFPVSVFETLEGWHVGVNGGHYANERTKEDAIEDARILAEELHVVRFLVYDVTGAILETVNVNPPFQEPRRAQQRAGEPRSIKGRN